MKKRVRWHNRLAAWSYDRIETVLEWLGWLAMPVWDEEGDISE